MTENLRYGAELPAADAGDAPRLHRRGRLRARGRDVQRRGRLPQAEGAARCVRRTWPPATRRTPPAAAPTRCATRWPGAFALDEPTSASKGLRGDGPLHLLQGCKTECPSSVDMAKIKTEFLAHYHDEHGIAAALARLRPHPRCLEAGTRAVAPLANLALRSPARAAGRCKRARRPSGAAALAASPAHVRRTLARCTVKHATAGPAETRGTVVYFHDTFTTYNYPRIGLAAVQLLEAAGFEVIVEERRACCGRPMLSKGLVDDARKVARKNVELLAPYAAPGIPIVGTEPSCILTLRDEYLDLLPGDADVAAVAGQTRS